MLLDGLADGMVDGLDDGVGDCSRHVLLLDGLADGLADGLKLPALSSVVELLGFDALGVCASPVGASRPHVRGQASRNERRRTWGRFRVSQVRNRVTRAQVSQGAARSRHAQGAYAYCVATSALQGEGSPAMLSGLRRRCDAWRRGGSAA